MICDCEVVGRVEERGTRAEKEGVGKGKGVVEGRGEGTEQMVNGVYGMLYWVGGMRLMGLGLFVESRRSFNHPQLYFQALNSNSRSKHMLATDQPESDNSRKGLVIPRRLSSSYCYAENLLPMILYHLFQSWLNKRHCLICILNGF